MPVGSGKSAKSMFSTPVLLAALSRQVINLILPGDISGGGINVHSSLFRRLQLSVYRGQCYGHHAPIITAIYFMSLKSVESMSPYLLQYAR